MSVSLGDFEGFFEAVHDRRPFPWQARLASQVLERGRWPDLVDLPTGAGKTAVLDIALFTLALRPDLFPRRIVLVVDRRVVVDQGAEHARKIRDRLNGAVTGPAAEVAAALRKLFCGGAEEDPFVVSVLRGGMPRDEMWANRPDRAAVVVSTVDQVGSRLLFRGYGVSHGMAPIHAGLLGNDALLFLDEVQLSTAFAETLLALHRRWRSWHGRELGEHVPNRWGVVRMSATPLGEPGSGEWRFGLTEEDRADPVLSSRLTARKLTTLRLVKVKGDGAERVHLFAQAVAKEARSQVRAGAVAVAAVVNRVDTARRVHLLLHDDTDREFDVVLLTGRMRPLDRMELVGVRDQPGSLASRVAAGRQREPGRQPLVVVATQCIEAGADFDFDALVTECASLDALRQRLGRLDRMGEQRETRCTVLARSDQVQSGSDDPIYGSALRATWVWLQRHAEEAGGRGESLDLGLTGFPAIPPDGEDLAALCSPVVHAPVLLPTHLDAWSQTNPRPEPDPDVGLWLHGSQRDTQDVQIVWRADLDAERLNAEPGLGHSLEQVATGLSTQLELCPPSSLEAVAVPIGAARAWLAGSGGASFGDVEGAPEDDTETQSPGPSRGRRCVRLERGRPEIIGSAELRPGDTVLVPSSYGGLAYGSWDPNARAFVADLGDWAQLLHRGRATLRLVEGVLAGGEVQGGEALETQPPWANLNGCSIELARHAPRVLGADDPEMDLAAALSSWIEQAKEECGPRLRTILDTLAPPGRPARYRCVEIAGGRLALVGRGRVTLPPTVHFREDQVGYVITGEDDAASFGDREVTLRQHLADVEGLVKAFAANLGVAAPLASDLALAARLHDVGKADPRFQLMLAAGNEVQVALWDEPLAKSGGPRPLGAARELARRRSAYPEGYRHELLSVAMLESTPEALDQAHDRDLVLHLVSSHHGWCRPLAPALDPGPPEKVEFDLGGLILRGDAAHGAARLDSGIADRFWELVERYGWWGLTWMEAIIRLADHRASEAEASG